METQKLELVVRNEDNKLALVPVVDNILLALDKEYNDAKSQYETFEEALLKAMLDNGLKKAETEHYNISVRENKSKWIFNEEAFKQGESTDIVGAFITTEKTRTFNLNIEKLKEKYPNVYEDCLEVEEHETSTLDTNKLWKTFPNIYNKYATEIKPEKPGTVSIKRKEE